MSVLLLRTIVVYALIIFAIRIMGKRQIGELQPSEFVITILISNLATLSIEDTNIPLLGTILPIFMLIICEVAMSFITLKFRRTRQIISGNQRVLIRDGVIDQKEMKNLRWSIDDLMEQLRVNNIFDVGDVSFAIVETSGKLSSYPRYQVRPLTPKTMGMADQPGQDAPPMVIVTDGELLPSALQFCNLTESWLHTTLQKEEIAIKDIFLMTCNRQAQYRIVPYQKGDKA